MTSPDFFPGDLDTPDPLDTAHGGLWIGPALVASLVVAIAVVSFLFVLRVA